MANKLNLNEQLKLRILDICDLKIAQKGDNVGLSFYAFFENKNTEPDQLMEIATWWIKTHQLDHFEKAHKIKQMIVSEIKVVKK